MEVCTLDIAYADSKLIKVEGEMDLYSFLPFVEEVMEALMRGAQRILIDASGLTYLDSSGVGGIIRILVTAKSKGAKIAFAGLQGSPHKVLAMSHILSLLVLYPTVTEAESFFKG